MLTGPFLSDHLALKSQWADASPLQFKYWVYRYFLNSQRITDHYTAFFAFALVRWSEISNDVILLSKTIGQMQMHKILCSGQ